MRCLGWILLLAIGTHLISHSAWGDDPQQYDVAVYAATPSGIYAAIAVKRGGKSVLLIEPSRWVG